MDNTIDYPDGSMVLPRAGGHNLQVVRFNSFTLRRAPRRRGARRQGRPPHSPPEPEVEYTLEADGPVSPGQIFDVRPGCLDAADADDSGRLDITDPIRILGYLFLGGAPPPKPGAFDPGADPTEDKLSCLE